MPEKHNRGQRLHSLHVILQMYATSPNMISSLAQLKHDRVNTTPPQKKLCL